MTTTMDLNCDLGEGLGVWRLTEDEALLEIVTSANVACGFHAGDPSIMRRVCAGAAANGVVVGAQVAYPDLAGFGRRFLAIDPEDLADAVVYQIGALDAIARTQGTRVSYVKAHGALYHALGTVPDQAEAFCRAVASWDASLPVVCSPVSAVVEVAANHGLEVVAEGFVDRRYHDDGTLVARSRSGAVIDEVDEVVDQALGLAINGEVVSIAGLRLRHEVQTLCIHGDTPAAVSLARTVRQALERHGVEWVSAVRRSD